MPLYDYKCKQCGHIFEIKQSIKEEPLKFCPECKGSIFRLISAAGIIFKGSGFHVTDYGKKPHKESKSSAKPIEKGTVDKPKIEKKSKK
ncbi:hypothetical protein A2291_06625 [candidate division WOR-1 bacterium RIFOXYB2_FULL_42_35]|uniref:Putative regulatory protein FmdB zinc ribbon domain-containing protein n=1 Tax=candidate division WOR-1 bacterium RIFOXYC2_FULL_41_25 TaxID=1802586 RepID=A0A1F4TPZ5_UNCSA|nr:MAG: hypothetical protein A2291_06625 [candidate division WOR-1 bacterium RIFOXYB2_FULL_42_35]OGC24555.1 MAG: hypothetical protein A2247_06405 [candidate division WOR-1 bacterium RIFOXYA2_FULL_41_14]OGC34600.1 MAG: hypothetical protein A2462_04640 [candidate division WOR-1 bacterium RIFOXYC2_FULL_41_25]OGC43993.1 MAG: hypothetical protein A2548_06325 [candidate division WOR-1 bacterium RIFOXYD2_FULL_41_8]